jgi:hypothetical protein
MNDAHSVHTDLALKKFTGTPQDQKPNYNWRDVLRDDVAVPEIEVLCPHGAERFDLAEVADTVGKSLANLMLAKGEKDIFNEKNQRFVADVTREVASNLTRQALTRAPLRVSLHDLYVLIEKTLVDNNAHDVAKSLLHKRAQKLTASREQPTVVVKLIRRNNQVVPWNEAKIEIAIRKAFLSLRRDSTPAPAIARAVTQRAAAVQQAFLHIEEVQDMVQEELMKAGHFKVAEDYILYRAARHAARAQESAARHAADLTNPPVEVAVAPDTAAANGQNAMIVVQRADGSTYFWNGEDLKKRIEFASIGLNLCLSADQIEAELRRSTFDNIGQGDLNNTIVLNAKTLIEKDADFAKFAGRIQLTYIYEEVLGWDIVRDGLTRLKAAHQQAFAAYIERGIAIKRLSPRLKEYNLARLAESIDPTSDLELDFLGVQTLYDRYLIIDKTGKRSRRLETPQFFWLRVAMGLFLDEKSDRENWALQLYGLYKSRRFCSSTPTLFNSGTLHSQLSSCYLYYVDDSLEGIMYRGIAENAQLSKWAGGLGGSWTAVRGTGAHIAGTNGESQGVIPFLKLHNDQLVAVNQGGKRKGSGCAYLETWHNDIFEFLELRRNTGDDRRRTHDMNTANWIPDLFMKRMEGRSHWTLFRSNETPDLHELYGRKFEERYIALREARRGRQDPGPQGRGPRTLEEDALDALRDRPPVDHLQGPLQRPLPAGPRRRHPFLQSLHRDHAQHVQRRDRRLQPRLRHPRLAPQARRLPRPRQAPRHHPHRPPRARQRHRHQLLPDRGRQALQPPPPPRRPRRHGPGQRPLPQGRRLRLRGRRRVQRRVHGGHRLLRLRGLLRPRGRARHLLQLQGLEVGPRPPPAGHPRPPRAGARRPRRGSPRRQDGLDAPPRQDRQAGHAQQQRASPSPPPRRSRTSPTPPPASSRTTRTSTSNRTSPASSSS